MQDNNNDFSFDEVLFNMIKNAIKAASVEMYQDTQEMFEESQELMEAQLEEIIQDVEEPKTLTIERMQEMVDDYKEMGTFAEVMDNIGYFKTPQDVVTLLTSPNKYRMIRCMKNLDRQSGVEKLWNELLSINFYTNVMKRTRRK